MYLAGRDINGVSWNVDRHPHSKSCWIIFNRTTFQVRNTIQVEIANEVCLFNFNNLTLLTNEFSRSRFN